MQNVNLEFNEYFIGTDWAKEILGCHELGIPVDERDLLIAKWILRREQEIERMKRTYDVLFRLFSFWEREEIFKRVRKGTRFAWPEIEKAVQKRLEAEARREAKRREKAALKEAVNQDV